MVPGRRIYLQYPRVNFQIVPQKRREKWMLIKEGDSSSAVIVRH